MGDFFYYGQKDTIQRLNELAGRGAVVASYAPAVGRSPLGGPNGYMTPAWLDPNLPIQTNARLCSGQTAKYGYQFTNSVGQRNWFLLATFSQDDAGTQENLLIRGTLNDSWLSAQTSAVTLLMGVRGGFYVDWHLEGAARGNARIIVYKHPNLTYGVYAFFDGFANGSFDLTGATTATLATPLIVDGLGPAGVAVFDTSALPGQSSYVAPRWRGIFPAETSSGSKATLFNSTVFVGNGGASTSFLNSGSEESLMAPGAWRNMLTLGIGGIAGFAYPGAFKWSTSSGNDAVYYQGQRMRLQAYDTGSGNESATLLSISGDGQVYVPRLRVGTSTEVMPVSHNVINAGAVQADTLLYVGVNGRSNPCMGILASDGAGNWGQPLSVFYVGKNSNTGRSMSAAGTVNTSGNDYAEYIFKSSKCGIVAPGQIVGITAENRVTDMWADAVMFSIKSTAPSFVGGDIWGHGIGPRPSAQAGSAPIQPLRRADVVTQQPVPGVNPPEYEDVVMEPGDTDAEWAEKQATYTAALAAHNAAVLQDAEAMAAFDAALETARQKVDRIAIAGRVPVNVLGTQPGDYIVPVQDGAGIKGIAVHEDDLSMKQYLHAVGRVISIEPDGRAYVMVKAV